MSPTLASLNICTTPPIKIGKIVLSHQHKPYTTSYKIYQWLINIHNVIDAQIYNIYMYVHMYISLIIQHLAHSVIVDISQMIRLHSAISVVYKRHFWGRESERHQYQKCSRWPEVQMCIFVKKKMSECQHWFVPIRWRWKKINQIYFLEAKI